MIDFLVSEQNLEKYRLLPLRARLRKFNLKYPEVNLSYSRLRMIFKFYKVRLRRLYTNYKLEDKKVKKQTAQRKEIFP